MEKEDIYSYYKFVYKYYQVVLQTKWMRDINIHFRRLIEINDDFISHTAKIEANKFHIILNLYNIKKRKRNIIK